MKHSLLSVPALVLLCSSAAHAQWSDNFDSYVATSQIVNQGGWEEWGPGAGAFVSSAQARSNPNSVEIAGPSDLVHQYANLTSGKWVYRAMQYVPSTMTGQSYFILLNRYAAPQGPYNWSVQVKFDAAAGTVTADAGSLIPASTTLVTNQWVEIKVFVDLDQDWTQFYYNGTLLDDPGLADHPTLGGGYQWSLGVFGQGGGQLEIQAVDLYANSASPVYYDDMSLQPFVYEAHGAGCPGTLGDVSLTQVLPPVAGGAFVAQIDNLPQSACFHILGLSRVAATAGPLPLDLAPYGAPGCKLQVSIDALQVLIGAQNSATFGWSIPGSPAFVGMEFYQQVLALDPTNNALGASLSNGMSIKIQ